VTDPLRSRDAGEGAGADIGRKSASNGGPPRAPRWVKVSVVIVGVLILLAVITKLTGGGHGPSRHTGARVSAPVAFADLAGPGLALGRDQVWTVAHR
jgi:hypothetical protein